MQWPSRPRDSGSSTLAIPPWRKFSPLSPKCISRSTIFLNSAPFTCRFEGSLPKDRGWRNAIQLQAAIPCTPRDPAVLPADNRTDPHHAALESADVKVPTPRRPAALHEANVSPASATNRPQPNRKSPHRLLWDPAPTHGRISAQLFCLGPLRDRSLYRPDGDGSPGIVDRCRESGRRVEHSSESSSRPGAPQYIEMVRGS